LSLQHEVLRKITNHCKDFIQHIEAWYKVLEEEVQSRKAWKRDRKYFAYLNEHMKLFSLFVALLMMIVEEQARNQEFSM
jgi:hypothetical protein